MISHDEITRVVLESLGRDAVATRVARALAEAGGDVYVVGGAVRDAILRRVPTDHDLLVRTLTADHVRATLRSLGGDVKLTGEHFSVLRYRDEGGATEVALPRREVSIGAGHRDFDVQSDPTISVEEDLRRRDFTANAMAVRLSDGRFVDPHDGGADASLGLLRVLDRRSFVDDPLRVMRGVVAASRHALLPEPQTAEWLRSAAQTLDALPVERKQMELDKLFSGRAPADAIRLAHKLDVLEHVLPEVDACFGFDQNSRYHRRELGEHLLETLTWATRLSDDRDLRLAALMHDVGKPGSRWVDDDTGYSHYYKLRLEDGTEVGEYHELLGSSLTSRRLVELRYSRPRVDRVSELVRHHMFAGFASASGARRFMRRVGEHADDLLTLRQADQAGKDEYRSTDELRIGHQRELVQRVREQREPTARSQLSVDGHDLVALGVQPGPRMGRILDVLTDDVVGDPALNQRDLLLARAAALAVQS